MTTLIDYISNFYIMIFFFPLKNHALFCDRIEKTLVWNICNKTKLKLSIEIFFLTQLDC